MNANTFSPTLFTKLIVALDARQADASGQEQQKKSERKISELTEENKRLGLEIQDSELDLKQQIEVLQNAKKKSCKQLHDSVAELGVVRTQLDEAQKHNLELEPLRKEFEKLKQQIGVSKNANEKMSERIKKQEKENGGLLRKKPPLLPEAALTKHFSIDETKKANSDVERKIGLLKQEISKLAERNRDLEQEIQRSKLGLNQQIDATQQGLRTEEHDQKILKLNKQIKELNKEKRDLRLKKTAAPEKEPETLGEPESTEVPRVSQKTGDREGTTRVSDLFKTQ